MEKATFVAYLGTLKPNIMVSKHKSLRVTSDSARLKEFNMISRLNVKLLTIIFFVTSTLVLANELGLAQTKRTVAKPTKFLCVSQGRGYATIAQRGNRRTSPLITWNSNAFGPQYTPEKRCNMVSQRLTQAVAATGGRLNTLRMTHGTVGSAPVICYIRNPEEECNSRNVLMTLSPNERGKENEILKQLTSFSVKGTGSPLTRAADGRTIVELGTEVENALE
jgi:hypothetical protein